MLGFVVRRPRGRLPLAARARSRPGRALAATAVVPPLSAFLIGRRRRDVAARPRHVEEM